MVYPISVVGIGPGHQDYLLPAATKAVEASDCLVGGKRALALFAHLDKPQVTIDGDLSKLPAKIKELRRSQRVAVLVSGDPGFYSLLSFLKRHFTHNELAVIPGISSMQLAFARIGQTWQHAKLYSVHGRSLEGLLKLVQCGGTTAVLLDNQNTPRVVAQYLTQYVDDDLAVYICSDLGAEDEKVIRTSLSRVEAEFINCVMVITDEYN